MGKTIFEFDNGEDMYDISLCTNRYKMAHMLDEVQNYVRHLNKYEERSEIPIDELIDRLGDMVHEWFHISND